MAANIGSMMYSGEVPWHGLGRAVLGAQTAQEAIVMAGLDWNVEPRGIYYKQDEQFIGVPDREAQVRTDTQAVLGILSNGFHRVQNKQGFNLVDSVMGEAGAHYVTAGCLGQGEVVWLLAKLPKKLAVLGDDVIEQYLLFVNSHNGQFALRMLNTPIRVVCQNTMLAAIGEAKAKGRSGFYARHNKTAISGLNTKNIREQLGYADAEFNVMIEASQKMARAKMNDADMDKMFKSLLGWPKDPGEEASTRMENQLKEITQLAYSGRGADMVRGTAWGAYNAVVEYVDYKKGTDNGKRATAALFGAGLRMKKQALELAMGV